jgi:hypothetical protein
MLDSTSGFNRPAAVFRGLSSLFVFHWLLIPARILRAEQMRCLPRMQKKGVGMIFVVVAVVIFFGIIAWTVIGFYWIIAKLMNLTNFGNSWIDYIIAGPALLVFLAAKVFLGGKKRSQSADNSSGSSDKKGSAQ